VIGSDGVIRIAVCLVFAAFGIKDPAPYAFAVALSPLVAVVAVSLRGQLETEDGPDAPWSEVTQNLGWLLLGTALAGGLLNAGPVAAQLLGEESDKAAITRFGYGVLIARIPLFMFQAVQAALLPRLARLAARGDFTEFKRGLRQLLSLVTIVGVVGTLGAFVLGPPVIEIMYDAELSGRTLAMLALSSALYMGALATSQAVVALHGHGRVAAGWAIAVAAFFVGTWLSSDKLFRRIEIGLVISSLAALIWFAIALRDRLAAGVRNLEGPIGPLPELPLEA
jgi:Na+-driven multidrug efflux pump